MWPHSRHPLPLLAPPLANDLRRQKHSESRRRGNDEIDPLRNLAAIALPVALTQDMRGPAATRTDPARRLSIHGVFSSMTVGPEARRAIVGALVGLLYGSVLALLSLFLFGGGGAHGTSIPLLLSSAPLGVFALVGRLVGEPYMGYGHNATVLGAPLVWAGLGWLVALSGQGTLELSRILALLHYTSGLALIATAGEEPARLQRLLQYPEAVMWVTIYLAGQAALWSSMRAGPEARQAIVGAMVGLLYGSVLIYLSIFATGGGHGTPVPLSCHQRRLASSSGALVISPSPRLSST